MASGKPIDALQNWIDSQGGRKAVAAMLGVSFGCIDHWYYRRSWPKTEMILRFIELSRGELSWDAVIASSTPDAKRNQVIKVLGFTARGRKAVNA